MIKGYTTIEELARYLGRDFDTDQEAIADLAISAAEIIIDRKISFKYLEAGPQIFSVWQPSGNLITIPAGVPISNVSVRGFWMFGSFGYDLLEGIHYEVRDLNKGRIFLLYPSDYYRIDITYTPTAAVPDNIKLAVNIMAAHWMRPIFNDEIPGLASYSIGFREFTVAFSQFVQQQGYPAEVDTLLGIPSLYVA